jgi:flagellar basal-body rod protein FlgG
MIYGILQSGLSAYLETIKLNVTANNLANINTPGYRKDIITFQERLSEAQQLGPEYTHANYLVERLGGAPFINSITFDPNQGAIENTSNPLDFAIDGQGFFAVKNLETGEKFYTRAGNFVRDQQGRLLTSDRKAQVINQTGDPIVIEPGLTGQMRVDETGRIYVGDAFVNSIGVYDFDDYTKLRKFGENLLLDLSNAPKLTSSHIRQGMLEGSNAEPMSELTNLIEINRMFEMNMNLLRLQDDVLQRTINDLPRLST